MRALPLSIVCVSKERSSAVAVWAAVSELVQRTRPPLFTVTVTGLYLKDLMSTVADCTGAPPAGAAVVEASGVGDCPDIPASAPEPPEPHPATSTPRSRTVAAGVRITQTLRRPPPGGSPTRRRRPLPARSHAARRAACRRRRRGSARRGRHGSAPRGGPRPARTNPPRRGWGGGKA